MFVKKFLCILSLIIFCGTLTMNNPAYANYKIIEKNGKKGLFYIDTIVKDTIVVPTEYDNVFAASNPISNEPIKPGP